MNAPNSKKGFLIKKIHYDRRNKKLDSGNVYLSDEKIPIIIKNVHLNYALDNSNNVVRQKKQLVGILIISNTYIPCINDRILLDNDYYVIESLTPCNNPMHLFDSKYSFSAMC